MMIGKMHIWLVVLMCLAHQLDSAKIIIFETRQLDERRQQLTQDQLNKVCGVSFGFNQWTGKEFPWMASITSGEGPFKVSCGGALISEQYVLTAAQCIIDTTTDKKKAAREFNVRLGNYDISDDVTALGHKVSKVITHPKFNHFSYNNDIALLRLEKPVQFGLYVAPICLPSMSEVIEVDTRPTVAGWGAVEVDGKPTTRLMYVEVNLIPTAECQKAFDKVSLTIFQSQLCAGHLEGAKGACYGDEGGPLMVSNADGRASVYGIVSNVQCGKAGFSDIYTRTTSYLKWIKKNAQIQ